MRAVCGLLPAGRHVAVVHQLPRLPGRFGEVVIEIAAEVHALLGSKPDHLPRLAELGPEPDVQAMGLQLTVVDHDQSMRQATIQVTVDNKPPTIKLTYPPDGEQYEAPKDEWIVFNADVADNFGIDRVEFWSDIYTKPFSIRYIAPYNDKLTFLIANPETKQPVFRTEVIGKHTFWAVVYDKAGIKVESNKVRLDVTYKKPQ
jgi:hypothetical protein